MKFIHTADIHFGITPDRGRFWSAERRDAVRAAFGRIIRACDKEKADLLLICGDFFHGRPLEDELREVNGMFALIPGTKVVILAGAEDPMYPSSPVLSFAWADNVTYLTGKGANTVRLDDICAEITGISVFTGENRVCEIPDASGTQGYMKILASYGGDESKPFIDPSEALIKGYDYIALGGCHKPTLYADGRMAYSGSPIPIYPEDTGMHGYYVGEAEDGKLDLHFEMLPGPCYINLNINVTPASVAGDVYNGVRNELLRRGALNIYRLKLRGSSNPGESFDLTPLCDEFRILDIEDETEPEYDFVGLFREHPSDMIGFFVEKLNTPDSSAVAGKALRYGVDALLKTADERKQE